MTDETAERFRVLASDPSGENTVYWMGKPVRDMADAECAAAHDHIIKKYGSEDRFAQHYNLALRLS